MKELNGKMWDVLNNTYKKSLSKEPTNLNDMAKKNSTTEKSELDLCKYKRPGISIHDEPTVYNPGIQWDEVQEFTEWCLSTDKYIYNKNNKSWFDNRGFKFLTWDEIYVKYLNEEHKRKLKEK